MINKIRRNKPRGLNVTGHDPDSRCIFFVADEATAKSLKRYGKVELNFREHATNDLHWILSVSRLQSFSSVLNDMAPEQLNAGMRRLFRAR